MQTKNINVDRGPLNNELETNLQLKNVNVEKSRAVNQETSHQRSIFPEAITDSLGNNGAPPLPPRTAIMFTPFSALSKLQAEVDGYGPYKPVPPPKPLPHAALSRQEGVTPPPYRMPPYPLYNEPITIPGAASFESPLATSSPANQSLGLQTHSNKFPIEREVILTSTDKNSKIPILHDYKKRTTAAIAPDAPPKQMAAWTQNQVQNHLILSPDQTHPNHVQTSHQQDNGLYRASYHSPSDYYNGQNPVSTGAVPRSTWHSGGDPNKPAPRPFSEDYPTPQTVSVQIESTKDGVKETNKNGKSMTKTYHTIKDMISSRFKGNKDCLDEKAEEAGLNNIADELRRSQRNLGDEQGEIKKTAGEQGIYGKPRIDQTASSSSTPSMYNQHMMQQHMIAQQAQQQFQINQQARAQQNAYVHQMAQARSQEMLTQSRSEDLYYQSQYISAQQRSIVNTGNRFMIPQNREQSYVQVQQHSQLGNINNKDGLKDERRQPIPMERRSAQQIERENQRQKNLADFRRAASQPQLNQDEEIVVDVPGSKPQPQIPSNFIRRGSHGNLVEATLHVDPGKDSDDGGFLKRNNSKEMKLDHNKQDGNTEFNNEEADFNQQNGNGNNKDDGKVTEALQGAPRKRLEGEIGKIEGVYNVGQRSKPEEDLRNAKKTPGSAASSDYDKTGGLSSSNVDSGRGSAAYSSGRRPNGLDIIGDTCDSAPLTSGSYRDLHASGHDSEWVDIVENELRHILEPKLHELSLHGQPGRANSAISESISSMTPPLPPLSPGDQSSPNVTPRNSARYKHSSSLPYGSKPDYDAYIKSKNHLAREVNPRWHGSSSHKTRSSKKLDHALLRNKQMFGLDTTTDLTSTTTRSLDLESMLDGQSDSEGDLSTADARTIRKQLEGLETMYSEVLKLLGVKKHGGRYQPSDPRFSKRRYGSMSSLPSSSVSSRPIRDKRKAHEDRKKVRDIRGINKRFQRLESHVVTLARSVAHLSSEMRTQHLMIQEMENIRGEIAALRAQTNMLNVRSQNVSRAVNSSKDLPSLANPSRVKKLTKFFGDEPPLLRLFLRKLGYEKYASVFENEKIGMVELPYMSEERLQKMGVPLGPRLRIMQEAQISVCKENTLCIV